MNPTLVNARPTRKFMFLPLLVFLFVLSYGLLTILVVLQDRTIDAQSGLIHLLFQESRRLNTMAVQPHQTSGVKNSPNQESKAAQVPLTQVQKSQNASAVPSSQEKAGASPGKGQHKARRRAPSQPPVETTDPSDMRRTLFSI